MNQFAPTGKAKQIITLIFTSSLVLTLVSIRYFSEAGQSAASRVARKPSTVRKAATTSSSPAAATQTLRNIGKAYYEQGKYPESADEFQKVVAGGHALASDHMDLGLALMQEDKLDAALGEMTTAKQMDPKSVAIDYSLGILYKRESRYPDAEASLKRVLAADPHEPSALLNLGVVYFSQNKMQDAVGTYQHLLDLGFGRGQNFYVAGLFRMATAMFRLRRAEEARKYLAIHDKVKDKVPSVSVQTAALEGGKYGAILVPTAPPTTKSIRPAESVTFADITTKLGINIPQDDSSRNRPQANVVEIAETTAAQRFGASLALGDFDGDGHPDIYVVLPKGSNHLFHNNGDGTFTDVTDKAGVGGHGFCVSATFADYDNSGHPSLFVTGLEGATLYHNNGDGTFTDVTEKAGLKEKDPGFDSQAVLFDADVDGFLDLVVTRWLDGKQLAEMQTYKDVTIFPAMGCRFYRNNGDGTFTEITEAAGFASAKGRMAGGVFADFNNDGYTDLLLFRDDGPPMLFINRGEDKFIDRTSEAGTSLTKLNAVDAQVADFNRDGNFDIALWGKDSYSVLLNKGNAKFEEASDFPPLKFDPNSHGFRGAVADVNGNGSQDLVAFDAAGKWHLFENFGGHFKDHSLDLPSGAGAPGHVASAWLAGPENFDLLALSHDGKLSAYEKQGAPAHWLEVKLTGSKSNMQGVGTIVEVKAGNFYEKVVATGDPVRIFTGDISKVDVVRVTWPNQIIQNSIGVSTDKPIEMRESERLSSSCPFLYLWNGSRFVYYTDILGMAPLGELGPDGSWSVPNPREFVRLPQDLHTQNGRYTFQVTDEMREADFVDQLRMVAVDHAANEEVLSNEIATSAPVPPSLYFVRNRRAPVSAVDDAGRNVRREILSADGKYPTGFRRNRILGLADVHSLTLDLGGFPGDAPVALWLKGWVFWTDSNAARALMNNKKLQMVMPYLQVRDERGRWVTAIPDMGLPSGTNRTMRVDLTGKFPTRDHHVRIVTNLCVYWDQVFSSTGDTLIQNAVAAGSELPLVAADLHYRGFSTPTSDPSHVKPDTFDYVKLLGSSPWNPMRGNYTRYGLVDMLLNSQDDREIVMSTGDEITVSFSASRLPPLKPGMKRDFFLYTAGYAKDGEPNTAYSKVVGPVPFQAMSKYPYAAPEHFPDDAAHQKYLREFETRPGRALIPPMAPALQ